MRYSENPCKIAIDNTEGPGGVPFLVQDGPTWGRMSLLCHGPPGVMVVVRRTQWSGIVWSLMTVEKESVGQEQVADFPDFRTKLPSTQGPRRRTYRVDEQGCHLRCPWGDHHTQARSFVKAVDVATAERRLR